MTVPEDAPVLLGSAEPLVTVAFRTTYFLT